MEFTIHQKYKYDRGLCVERGCRKKRHGYKCYCHRRREWANANPIKYLYGYWRGNCIRRGKDFSVTFDEFKVFIKETDYDKLKGRTKLCLSVDRDNNDFGYHAWNIKALTVSENSKKRNYVDFAVKDNSAPF